MSEIATHGATRFILLYNVVLLLLFYINTCFEADDAHALFLLLWVALHKGK